MTILYAALRLVGIVAVGIVMLFAAIILGMVNGCRITR